MFHYKPYAKQRLFHAAGCQHRERLLIAGNQLGKSYCAANELAMHLSGHYPDWWPGRRFSGPVRVWAAGVTLESTRDNPQRLLLGQSKSPGLLANHWLESIRRGSSGSVDELLVGHRLGGFSELGFKSYTQGREKWQGPSLDLIWFDEEPPEDVYLEGLTRTNATGGLVMITFTPLKGYSAIVQRFLAKGQAVIDWGKPGAQNQEQPNEQTCNQDDAV